MKHLKPIQITSENMITKKEINLLFYTVEKIEQCACHVLF